MSADRLPRAQFKGERVLPSSPLIVGFTDFENPLFHQYISGWEWHKELSTCLKSQDRKPIVPLSRPKTLHDNASSINLNEGDESLPTFFSPFAVFRSTWINIYIVALKTEIFFNFRAID